jgi:hypothetical protein
MYHHFQQYFSYIVGQLVAVSFIGGGNPILSQIPWMNLSYFSLYVMLCACSFNLYCMNFICVLYGLFY